MSIASIAAVFGVVLAAGKQGRLQPEHPGPTRRISRRTPGFGTTDRDTIQSPLTSMNASSTIDGRVHLVVAQRLSFFRSKLGQTIDRVVGRHGWGCAGFQPGHRPASIRQYQMFALLNSSKDTFSVPPKLHHGDQCHGSLPVEMWLMLTFKRCRSPAPQGSGRPLLR